MENLTTPEQLINVAIFVAGSFILSWCAKVERKEGEERHDRKEKWAYIDGRKEEQMKKRSFRGLILTLLGGGMAIYGFINFLINV